MKIIGIGGTLGAGKDTLGEILQKNLGYLFVPATDLLREEAKKRGLAIEREVLFTIGNEWRREKGLGVLVDKAVEQFETNSGNKKYNGLAVASIRNPGEVDRIHELGGKLVWVDADPKVRYQRIISRMRSDEDRKTYDQFLAEEQAEMDQKGDSAVISLKEVKKRADIFIVNDGNSIEQFKAEVKKALRI